jgi:site-specific recombinase XerD
MLHFRSKPLPEVAENFLRVHAASRTKNTISLYRAALHHFYRFLGQAKLDLSLFTEVHLALFDQDLEQHHLKFVTRRSNIQLVHRYLRWLEQEGTLEVGYTKKLFPNYRPEFVTGRQAQLPERAERFLEVMGAISKENTVNGYTSTLRAFYKIQWSLGTNPYKIERTAIETFLVDLKNRNIHVNTRFQRLIHLRRYFDWLHEHGKLKTAPDKLITPYDFPKTEERLPRPFPPAADIEIQKRLGASNEIDHLGVLLMRRCGLRVGELRNLTFDCVTEDFNGNWFLKVPLGKLNNERIIPLDPETLAVVEKIKRHHSLRPEPGSETVYLISNPSGRRRGKEHFNPILQDVARGLVIPGKVTVHRLRHSFATSLLSAGLPLTTLKVLLGHRDIRMTLNYAAVTQETVRNEYFTALSKIHSRYEVASYPLKVPDLKSGINRSFYESQKLIKKFSQQNEISDPEKLTKLLYRLNSLRNEFSVLLGL